MQTTNLAGKPAFVVSDEEQLRRLLSVGPPGCPYCVTNDNFDYVSALVNGQFPFLYAMIENNPKVYKDTIKEFEYNKKCKKQNPLVFCLAVGATYKPGTPETLQFRKHMYDELCVVCKTPSTLNMFINYCKQISLEINGSTCWNNLHKKAILGWYRKSTCKDIAYLITKYRKREGYSHKDIFRLLHPKPTSPCEDMLYTFIVKDEIRELSDCPSDDEKDLHTFLRDYKALSCPSSSVYMIQELILKHNFAREHLPTQWLNEPMVWECLIPNMPSVALLRNLNKITALGVLQDGISRERILNKIKREVDVHPIQMLVSQKMYDCGHGAIGSLRWAPDFEISKALANKFMDIPPAKNIPDIIKILIGLDISGSMQAPVYGASILTARDASMATAMILKKKYGDRVDVMGFSTDFIRLNIDPDQNLQQNIAQTSRFPFGYTDISLPFTWALKQDIVYHVFIAMTDSETNASPIDPMDALHQYRRLKNVPNAGLVVLATNLSHISVGDPMDKNVLNICGFDQTVPLVIEEFLERYE